MHLICKGCYIKSTAMTNVKGKMDPLPFLVQFLINLEKKIHYKSMSI